MPICKSYMGFPKGCEKTEGILKSFRMVFCDSLRFPNKPEGSEWIPPFRKPIEDYSKKAQEIHLNSKIHILSLELFRI